jgi:hypothetical protein
MTRDELQIIAATVRQVRRNVENAWSLVEKDKGGTKSRAAATYHGQCEALREVTYALAQALMPEATERWRQQFIAACLIAPQGGPFTRATTPGGPGTAPPLPRKGRYRRKGLDASISVRYCR